MKLASVSGVNVMSRKTAETQNGRTPAVLASMTSFSFVPDGGSTATNLGVFSCNRRLN